MQESRTMNNVQTLSKGAFKANHAPPRDSQGITIFTKLTPAQPTKVYDTYWRFAVERQNIFFARLAKLPFPWTKDEILKTYKFTNAYRASDRVSQFLIRNVIYFGSQEPEEVFFRIILFKTFNRIETWQSLCKSIGEIRFDSFKEAEYDTVLGGIMKEGIPIYSGAYMMTSGRSFYGKARKHQNHLRMLSAMMKERVALKIAKAQTMREVFDLLLSFPTIGYFLAYQYSTDLNYSNLTAFSEMDFVVPGPGAKDGIRKCFDSLGGFSETDIIKMVTDRQEAEFGRLGLEFKSLWGRRLQLIDCQNLFCEVDKYARVAHPDVKGISGRQRIKQKYLRGKAAISPWYPPKWKINHQI
jgi:hypothetical protein